MKATLSLGQVSIFPLFNTAVLYMDYNHSIILIFTCI